jgi:hypothetical protein
MTSIESLEPSFAMLVLTSVQEYLVLVQSTSVGQDIYVVLS